MEEKNEKIRKKYLRELEATKTFNRRVGVLNAKRVAENKRQYQLQLDEWKTQCNAIALRNDIRQKKWNRQNGIALEEYSRYKSQLVNYNTEGEHICGFDVKILNTSDHQLEINNPLVVVFSNLEFVEYADIVVTNNNVGQIEYLLHVDTVKLLLMDTNSYAFVTPTDWGYEGVGQWYGFLNTKVVPKFQKKQFQTKSIKKFEKKKIILEKLPKKPIFVEVKNYSEKPLPMVPMEYAVAVEFNSEKFKFNFGTWKK